MPQFQRLIPETKSYTVSMRHAVVPSEGFLILAADYSQLELRILAHLGGYSTLGWPHVQMPWGDASMVIKGDLTWHNSGQSFHFIIFA